MSDRTVETLVEIADRLGVPLEDVIADYQEMSSNTSRRGLMVVQDKNGEGHSFYLIGKDPAMNVERTPSQSRWRSVFWTTLILTYAGLFAAFIYAIVTH